MELLFKIKNNNSFHLSTACFVPGMRLRAVQTWSHLILSEIHEELPCYDHRPETWGLERLSNSWFVFFFFFNFYWSIVYLQCCVWCGSLVAQSCLTLCDPSIHKILQARILEQVAISVSRGFSWPRDRAWVSCIGGQTLPTELWGKPNVVFNFCCVAKWLSYTFTYT